MRRRIFWAILGVSGIVLFLVFSVSALVRQSNDRDRMVRQLHTTTEVVAEQISGNPRIRALSSATNEEAARVLLGRNGQTDRLDDGTVIRLGLVTETFAVFAEPADQIELDMAALRNGEILTVDQRAARTQTLAVVRPVAFDDTASRYVAVVAARSLDRVRLADVLRELAAPLIVAAIIAALVARLAANSIVQRLYRLRDAARQLGSGDWSARASVGGNDEVAELASTMNDLAEFLQETSSRERAFLMSVSHDLRTPLTTVAGYAEFLAQVEDDETRRIGQVLEREARRLRRLVEDVMLLAQLEARQFSVRPEPVDLAAHVSGVVGGVANLADATHVDIVVDVEPTGLVVTDADRVDQIVSNLLDNAIRHTPERGVIRVAVAPVPGGANITVTDSGPGVDPDEIDSLFERFYVGRRHERPEGSGLGLSIVRKLVTMLGGTVTGNLPSDGGLSVVVSLPNLPPREGAGRDA